MKELVRLSEAQIGNDKINAVDARELHTFLKVGKDFSTWIKSRIDQYNFVENIDYIVLTNYGENLSGGRPKQEYIISLDMAKELSMVEKNDKGKDARRYFIECERRLYNTQADIAHFEKEMLAIKYAGEILNLSDVSKLGMMQRLFEVKGFDKSSLPVYVESKRVHFSASKLLEDHGKPLSAMAFNQLMIANGFLEEKTRPSSNGSTKTFKFLTDKSENFGLNLVSPKNDKETQPHYYEDSFSDLLKLLLNQE